MPQSGSHSDPDSFYRELTARNAYFIPAKTQERLRRIRILVAGCGSTGGACTQSLARVGVEHFALADNGTYELNNLNRQHALTGDVGQNKALFHAARISGINPHAEVQAHPEGITPENVTKLTDWAEVIMDAVDVTTSGGIAMKLRLHECARAARKPVFTALDLGFCQWGRSYDYRDPGTALLGGTFEKARSARHPLKALFAIVPVSAIPAHALPLVRDILKDSELSASQLGATSDLLSSIIVAAMVRFANSGEVLEGWNIDLHSMAHPLRDRLPEWIRGLRLRAEVSRLLREVA